jgi:hypothetical protein
MAFEIVEVAGAVSGTTKTAEHDCEDLFSPEETDNKTRVSRAGTRSKETPFDVDRLAGVGKRCDARTTE